MTNPGLETVIVKHFYPKNKTKFQMPIDKSKISEIFFKKIV